MTINQRAAFALACARVAGVAVPAETGHLRRLRAALARDIAVMLGVPTTHVLVTADPARGYGGDPGQLITVRDPDDPAIVLRFIPETGNTGGGGGAYLLLDSCPVCSTDQQPREVPMMSVAGLADLGHYQQQHTGRATTSGPTTVTAERHPEVPVEFFDDPTHDPHCPLR